MGVTNDNKIAGTLLYVEDDQEIQELVIQMLARKFPQLILLHAENGKKGLELFSTKQPDIIVFPCFFSLLLYVQELLFPVY